MSHVIKLQVKDEKKHSDLPASGAERWLNCAGSVKAGKDAPPEKDSKYAEEGTDAHNIMEYCLTNKVSAFDVDSVIYLDGKKEKRKFVPSAEMKRHVADFCQYVYSLADDVKKRTGIKPEILVEQKVKLDHIHPDLGGTVDVAIIADFAEFHIIDFKYGAGKFVTAEDNHQLMVYALGIAHGFMTDFERFGNHIFQPRYSKADAGRSKIYEFADITKWTYVFSQGVKRTMAKEPKFFPGSWCHWCKAKRTCPEMRSKALAVAQQEFDAPIKTPPDPKSLSAAQLSEVLKKASLVETWIEAVKEHATQFIEDGGEIPDFTLVDSISHRRWKPGAEEFLAKKLGSKMFEKVCLSPSKLEKKFPRLKKVIDERSARFVTGKKLVPYKGGKILKLNAVEEFD